MVFYDSPTWWVDEVLLALIIRSYNASAPHGLYSQKTQIRGQS